MTGTEAWASDSPRPGQADGNEGARYLDLPGARLSFEVTGAGPVLLMIPGGAADAGSFANVAERLASQYTVVTYDPRGISRSRLSHLPAEVPLELHVEDARQLLLAIGEEPASVFGSSGGAVIGLALATRHPERVRTLVAHEPPLVTLLPEGTPGRASANLIHDTYLKEGAGPAIATFVAVTGLGVPEPRSEPDADSPAAAAERMARMQQNVEFFLAHYLLPITLYEPDFAALRSGPTRVVVGVGEESNGQLANDTARVLADRLGVAPVAFPGGHSGFMSCPRAFAERLSDIFQIE